MIAGIDEAGRGAVIGPLVIAGVCCNADIFNTITVRDSKRLSPAQRTAVYTQLKNKLNNIVVMKITPEEIDKMRKTQTLNQIELNYFAEIIKKLACPVVYVDAVDVNESRFQKDLKSLVGASYVIIAKHKADALYPIVSAASIIAKVIRDREIESIKAKLGEFGSGYPSDSRTIRFLHEYYAKHRKFPPYLRRSWKTTKHINTLEIYENW